MSAWAKAALVGGLLVVAACLPVLRQSRAWTRATIGVGALLGLVGWTGVHRRPESATSPNALVHAGS